MAFGQEVNILFRSDSTGALGVEAEEACNAFVTWVCDSCGCRQKLPPNVFVSARYWARERCRLKHQICRQTFARVLSYVYMCVAKIPKQFRDPVPSRLELARLSHSGTSLHVSYHRANPPDQVQAHFLTCSPTLLVVILWLVEMSHV